MQRFVRLLTAASVLLLLTSVGAWAQRARTVADPAATPQPSPAATTAPAPQTVKAKYEGGVLGYMKKQTGTLSFDDQNQRLVFRDEQQHEHFTVPYEAVSAVYPSTKAQTSSTGRVISSVPTPYGVGLLGLLMRSKSRYIVIHLDDPDSKARTVTSFKLDDKDTLASVINTLAQKADLTQRGEAYMRKPKVADNKP
jgi:hypothetical protein